LDAQKAYSLIDFKHLIISTGAVNVLSNAKKNKSQGNILQSKREKGWLQIQAVWVIYNKLDCVNIEQGFVVGKILVLATLLCSEKKMHFPFILEKGCRGISCNKLRTLRVFYVYPTCHPQMI